MDPQKTKTMQSYSIICLNEAWLEKEDLSPKPLLGEYDTHVQLVERNKTVGRSKGGLAVFIKKSYQNHMIEKNNWWIAFEVELADRIILVVIFVYFNPSNDITIYLEYLTELILQLELKYQEASILVCGDFNAGIGNLNSFDEKYDYPMFEHSTLTAQRQSLDTIINSRANKLTNNVEELGYTVSNGRTEKDTPAIHLSTKKKIKL